MKLCSYGLGHMTKMAAVCSYGLGHMTKMAAMPVYGKNLSKNFISGTIKPITLKHGM